MEQKQYSKPCLIDGSRLVIDALVKGGADVFIGYPITPANLLYYYGTKAFPVALPAPDEITTLQWMCGFAVAGKFPVTATSFPGFALMLETVNMAYMMELPMVIVLVQRLGPCTGTATAGAQGDLALINGAISGGYPLVTMSIPSLESAQEISYKAMQTAIELRTPVILLTSKEMMMPLQSFDMADLPEIKPIERKTYNGTEPYLTYKPLEKQVPGFLPAGNPNHQIRINASTHDWKGIIQHTSPEALGNTKRLQEKLLGNLNDYLMFEWLHENDDDILLVAFDISARATYEAYQQLRDKGKRVSLLIPTTLFPVADMYFEIFSRYRHIIVVEENLNGQYRQILFGQGKRPGISGVNAIGKMIQPNEIIEEVSKYE